MRNLLLCLAARLCAGSFLDPLAIAAEPQMSWLDNGTIRLGVDLQLGGAITWLSRSGQPANVVNSFDWGRQVQMSYYAGPVPFTAGEKKPRKNWEGLGWNPIQAGDDFGNRSRVVEQRNDGRTLYVKCIPMQWPLENVPGECTFESWLELDGAVVKARARLVNHRSDRTLYAPRRQELPAVYTNAPWHRIVSYTGARPFAGEEPGRVEALPPPQWNRWLATENWAALVGDTGWGLGVWNPDCVEYVGGFSGKPREGGPTDGPCGYLAPVRTELLDHNIIHDYRYHLILGTLQEIRAHVYRQPRPLPTWVFTADRQGWRYQHAQDQGWPVRGELVVSLAQSDPALLSPPFAVPAETVPVLVIEAAFVAVKGQLQIFWSTLETPGTSGERSLRLPVQPDGQYREYRVRLADSAIYRGLITGLRIDPGEGSGGELRLRAVRLAAE